MYNLAMKNNKDIKKGYFVEDFETVAQVDRMLGRNNARRQKLAGEQGVMANFETINAEEDALRARHSTLTCEAMKKDGIGQVSFASKVHRGQKLGHTVEDFKTAEHVDNMLQRCLTRRLKIASAVCTSKDFEHKNPEIRAGLRANSVEQRALLARRTELEKGS